MFKYAFYIQIYAKICMTNMHKYVLKKGLPDRQHANICKYMQNIYASIYTYMSKYANKMQIYV
jgi:hypothetical protein